MSKYKVGTVLYGNDGYAYRVKAPKRGSWYCSQCIFMHKEECRMHYVLNIVSCQLEVEGVFEHIKIKGGI